MAYVEHNHNTYGINELRQPGECPACDERWGEVPKPAETSCPYCGKLVYVTMMILLTWRCPHCKRKWYDG